MSKRAILVGVVGVLVIVGGAAAGGEDSRQAERMKRFLQRYPQADADGDGVLTVEEAKAFRDKMARQRAKQADKTKQRAADGDRIRPTMADVKYGPYGRNVLDFYKAESKEPTPLVVYIHGGGFVGGDKKGISRDVLKKCLAAGVSVAAIHYRFLKDAPLPVVLRDSGRAIQFMRYKANQWNIDKKRVAAFGGSAGAGTSLWLGFHDDLADPKSKDPVLRESSRLSVIGAFACQFTYDFTQWTDVIGENPDGDLVDERREDTYRRFFGFDASVALDGAKAKKALADVDMRGHLSKDDSPVFLWSAGGKGDPENRGHFIHHPRHAMAIKSKCDQVHLPCKMALQADNPSVSRSQAYEMMVEFFFKYLKVRN